MGDSKSKKTINKLGKLFGVSATNLNQLGEEEVEGKVKKPQSAGVSLEEQVEVNGNKEGKHEEEQEKQGKPSPVIDTSSPVEKVAALGASGDGAKLEHPKPRPLLLMSMNDGQPRSSSSGHRSPLSMSPIPGTVTRKANSQGKPNPVSRSSSMKMKTFVSKDGKEISATPVSAPPPSQSPAALPRFKLLADGSHEHHLRSAKRQEKLSNMVKDLLGAKKLRDEAKSAVPNILQTPPNSQQPNGKNKPPTLFAGLFSQMRNNNLVLNHLGVNSASAAGATEHQDSRSFVEKYGRCHGIIGKGSFGVVRLSHKKLSASPNGPEVLYAVKEFKRKPNESDKQYSRRLTSEFCISSSLKHINIIDTLDLLKDAKGEYCEVMEYCSGGDLFTLIVAAGKLEYAEADCFFKQLIRGVNYMHDVGVSHRDLKPENLILTQDGILKITDFGNGECFRMAWEEEIQFSEGICGSSPYIAPEVFTQKQFDPRGVDIWACGVIYMAMRTGRQLWKLADPKKDEFFEEYLLKRKDASGYEPIESLKRARCRNVIYSILDPKPERRINGKQILNSEWGREIQVCNAGMGLTTSRSPEAGSNSPVSSAF